MIRHPPRLYKRPKDLGQTRTYWWHDGWIAPELRLYAPDQERTPSDDEDERPVLPSHSTRVVTTVTPRRELDAAEGAATNGPADGGAGSPDARPQAPDGGAIPRGWTNPGKRVKWTPQLKALFREALAAAGANGGRESPTRILDFMNRRANTGLTRVNVASYLQKYRKAQERLEQRRAASDHYRMYATEHQRAIELAEAERLFANPRLVAPQPHYPPPLTKQQHAVLAPGPMGVPYMSPGGMPGIGAGFGGASGASGFGRGVGVAGPSIGMAAPSIGMSAMRAPGMGGSATVTGQAPRAIAPRPAPIYGIHAAMSPVPNPAMDEARRSAELEEARQEARMLETIRLRTAEVARVRAERAAEELAAKELAARTITPEVRGEPPGQVGGSSEGSEGTASGLNPNAQR